MTSEKYPVRILKEDGTTLDGELQAWEESPLDPDSVLVKLETPNFRIEKTADDFFSALVEIRKELEQSGLLLSNYGSSLDVYPSPMSRNMGAGEKAYKLVVGRPAKSSDLVSIFDSGPDVKPSKVADQEKNYLRWLESLKH